MRREDYLPEDLLPRPANWYGEDCPEPDFKECPNDPDKVWVLSSGGYILYDKHEEDRGIDMSDTCTCEKETGMKDWIANHAILSEDVRGIIVLNGITRAKFEDLLHEIGMALESKSFKDGLLVLRDVPEVLYIPVGGANDQVGG